MKHFFMALFLGLFLFFQIIHAQTEKGKTIVAISSALGIGGTSNGFAFSSNKTKSDNFNSDPIKITSFNLSPIILPWEPNYFTVILNKMIFFLKEIFCLTK